MAWVHQDTWKLVEPLYTRFPTHLAWSSSKFEHMGNVTLLEGHVVSNIIELSKELELVKDKSHGRGRD